MGILGVIEKIESINDSGEKTREVTIDTGSGDFIEAAIFSAPGEDSTPLSTDYVATSSQIGGDGHGVVGFLDPSLDSISAPGEVRRYSRDSQGAIKAAIHLKNDGQIEISNESVTLVILGGTSGGFEISLGGGKIEMASSGEVTINGSLKVSP